VINLPTLDLIDTVVGIGNRHGADIDKFERFGLTRKRATRATAPLIAECYANDSSPASRRDVAMTGT